MSYGFVYVLSNIAMPGVYKIGRTNGSPAARAKTLSSATGVPCQFSVVCYAEMTDCVAAEAMAHDILRRCRVSNNREFFRVPVDEIVSLLRESDYCVSFCDVEVAVARWDEGPYEATQPVTTDKTVRGFQ